MNHRVLALFLAILGSMVSASSAHAQGRVAFAVAPRGPAGRAFSRGGAMGPGFVGVHRGRRFFAGSGFVPYFYPYFYPDYGYDQNVIETPQPQVVVVPSAQAAAPAPAPNPPESLVMELQGDHWARLTNSSPSASAVSSRALQTPPPKPLPPAVLVFRDGRTQEVGKYVIVGPTIYASADYWSSGSWTRKVQIADLNVPATLKLNQERGAKFSLPSGPNEVMMRP